MPESCRLLVNRISLLMVMVVVVVVVVVFVISGINRVRVMAICAHYINEKQWS